MERRSRDIAFVFANVHKLLNAIDEAMPLGKGVGGGFGWKAEGSDSCEIVQKRTLSRGSHGILGKNLCSPM